MLPILHLNGYKIFGPTVLGRDSDAYVRKLLEAHGYEVTFVEGPAQDDDPMPVHRAFSAGVGRLLDPGILTYVQKRHGLTVAALDDVLNHGAGLQGVSGVYSDYHQIEAAAQPGRWTHSGRSHARGTDDRP